MANIIQDGSYVLAAETEDLKGFEQELEPPHHFMCRQEDKKIFPPRPDDVYWVGKIPCSCFVNVAQPERIFVPIVQSFNRFARFQSSGNNVHVFYIQVL